MLQRLGVLNGAVAVYREITYELFEGMMEKVT